MRVLICDDEDCYIHPLRKCLEQYAAEHSISFNITEVSQPWMVFTSKELFDIAFLDIHMEGIDGLTLAKALRKRNRKATLFFITNYEGYQDSAMDLQALRYFTKPFDRDRLASGLDKALEYINGAYVDVFLYSSGVQQRILVDDILYLTTEGRKVAAQTSKERFIVTSKLDDWLKCLPHTFFRQPHKSFLVNLHHVNCYSYSELQMADGARIPIAPKKQSEFRHTWFEYIGR